MTEFKEAKEEFGKMVRWTEEDKHPDKPTVYLGTVLQGIYMNKREDVGPNESSVYEIRHADGTLYSMWGSDLLDGKFQQIPVGSEVRITCLGITQPKTPKGRAYMNFKVEYAKPVVAMNEAVSPGANSTAAAAPVKPAPSTTGAAAAPVDDGY